MKSNLVGRVTPEMESICIVDNLLREIVRATMCGDAQVTIQQLEFVVQDMVREDFDNAIDIALLAIRDCVAKSIESR